MALLLLMKSIRIIKMKKSKQREKRLKSLQKILTEQTYPKQSSL